MVLVSVFEGKSGMLLKKAMVQRLVGGSLPSKLGG